MEYFKDANTESLEKLLISGFRYSEESWSDIKKFKETYEDRECTILKFKPAFRSFNALHNIVNSYLPVSREYLANTIVSMQHIGMHPCHSTHKYTFYYTNGIYPLTIRFKNSDCEFVGVYKPIDNFYFKDFNDLLYDNNKIS